MVRGGARKPPKLEAPETKKMSATLLMAVGLLNEQFGQRLDSLLGTAMKEVDLNPKEWQANIKEGVFVKRPLRSE